MAAGSFLIFTLLYTPCVAAVATIRRELGSKLQTLGVVVMQCVVAWLAAGIFYQLGEAPVSPWTASFWLFWR